MIRQNPLSLPADASPTTIASLVRAIAVAPFVVCFAWIWRLAFVVPVRSVLMYVPDDSFFYFQIGMHFPETLRFTQDLLHDTYGFQPLWQFVLSIAAFFFDDREAFLRFGVFLLGLGHLLAGALLMRFLKARAGTVAALAGGAFWLLNPPLLRWSMGGKENALYAILMIAVLSFLGRDDETETETRHAVVLGVLMGLLFLARVNSLGFVGLAGLALLSPWGLPGRDPVARVRFAGLAGLCASAVAGPWLLYAQSAFGTWLPTSGRVKLRHMPNWVMQRWDVEWMSPDHLVAAFGQLPRHAIRLTRAYARPHLYWYLVVLAIVLVGIIVILLRRDLRRGLPKPLPRLWVPVAVLATWALASAWMNWAFLPRYVDYAVWYAVPELVLLTVGFALATAAVVRFCPGTGVAVAAAAGALPLVVWHEAVPLLRLRPLPGGWWSILGLLTAALAAWLLTRRSPRDPAPAWRTALSHPSSAIAALGLAFVTLGVVGTRIDPPGAQPGKPRHSRHVLYEVGLWARDHLPVDAVAGGWSSGILAYFSERRVISMEGLANDLDYIHVDRRDRPAYIRENNIEYLFGPGARLEDGGFEFRGLAPGTHKVEWVPFPRFDRYWAGRFSYMMVRPDSAQRPLFEADQFPFGRWRPNSSPPDEPERRDAQRRSTTTLPTE